VAAEVGSDLDGVVAAAETANTASPVTASSSGGPVAEPAEEVPPPRREGSVSRTAILINESGLHARPASEFVRAVNRFDAQVTVNGVDGRSLLRIMSLGLGKGAEVNIEASGPEASDAVNALTELIGTGFGE